MKKRRVVTALGWYTEQQWPDYCRIMEDGPHDSYADWLIQSQDLEGDLKNSGAEVVRIPINLAEFKQWCDSHGKRRDANARSEFVLGKLPR